MNYYKTVFLSLALLSFSLLLPFAQRAYAATILLTTVSGVVRNSANHVEPGVNVSVTCNGHTLPTTTLPDGTYQVVFQTADNCIVGDTVTASGIKGSASGHGSATVHTSGTFGIVTLDFAVDDFTVSVPEFSTTLGLFTGMLSLGGFLTLRKKTAVS